MLFRADSRRCCRPHYGVRVLRSVKLLEMIVLTRRKLIRPSVPSHVAYEVGAASPVHNAPRRRAAFPRCHRRSW
jgi:hypothetical protein